MKRFLSAMLVVGMLAGLAYAADYESITVTDTAQSLTKSNFLPPDSYNDKAYISVETATVRFRIDGTAPTSAEGHVLNSGDTIELTGRELLNNFKVIRQDATNATIKVTYHMEDK